MTPVPGLSAAFTLFSFIVSSVQAAQERNQQLEALAKTVGQLLAALDSEFRESRLSVSKCGGPLAELKTLLEDIHRFVHKEQGRGFFKSLVNKDARIAIIDAFYRRIGISVSAFQISGLLSIQDMVQRNEIARNEDANALNTRLKSLERNQVSLRETLEINQDNMLAMMACIQRRLDGEHINPPEQKFYSHTLQYLTSMSGRQVKLEDWMVASFDVEYGSEIGAGGFGKVYLGTWNRTNVAIKVLHNVAGVTPNVMLLRKEIDIWLNLRHPNILQFLGANTLDSTPFVVMPYIPHNARQFLQQRPTFDPAYILRDISLGLQYLHSRKICHGDIKGKQLLGEENPETILTMSNLAEIYKQLGQLKEAAELLERVMKKQKQVLGDDHLHTLLTMNNLVHTYFELSRFQEAKELELAVMNTQKQVLGADHPDTLDAMSNMVEIHNKLGQLKEAEELGLVVMKERKRVLGEDHRRKYQKAEELGVVTMKKGKQVFGEDHPTTVMAITGLTETYYMLGQFKEAEEFGQARFKEAAELLERVMKKQKQVLGDDHLHTLLTMNSLARTYFTLSRFQEAKELGLAVMNTRKQILGVDHPDTLDAMSNMVEIHNRLGQLKEAEELGLVTMEKQKQVLGEDHQSTLHTMANLVINYNKLGKYEETEELGVMVVKKRKQVLGQDHPDTLRAMALLIATYHCSGQLQDAEELGELVVKKQKQILGEGHPDTLQIMATLGVIYDKLGKLLEATKLGQELIMKQKQILGEEHPDTLHTMVILTVNYNRLEKFQEAEELGVEVINKGKQVLGEDHPHTLMAKN
ncbi:hypothetical protein C8R44DRAFT_986984, partial [Mycena epipterygia]